MVMANRARYAGRIVVRQGLQALLVMVIYVWRTSPELTQDGHESRVVAQRQFVSHMPLLDNDVNAHERAFHYSHR
jgi:hypothetical protein